MYHHLGFDYVRTHVGHKYFILKIRSILRIIRYQCIPCRKRDAVIVNPMMADLSKERLGYLELPFSKCGVEYFGPFIVSIRRSSEKIWAFLFKGLTSRAIHLEIASSMDTSACDAGNKRFIARRGMPKVIWSNNGSNFVGAEKELLEVIPRWNDYAPAALACKGIRWKFNPPIALHQGGSWERMVRSCKRIFYSILGNRRMTDETLNTTFCLVEQALNNRPLTPVSADPNELEALTPNLLLLGRSFQALPSLVPGDEPDLRRRYTKAQAYANAKWVRWMKKYVPPLHKRGKSNKRSDISLKSGELVWVVTSANPRGCHPLARITSLRYGADSVSRSAELQTSTGPLVRTLVKLAPVFGPTPSLGAEDVVDKQQKLVTTND